MQQDCLNNNASQHVDDDDDWHTYINDDVSVPSKPQPAWHRFIDSTAPVTERQDGGGFDDEDEEDETVIERLPVQNVTTRIVEQTSYKSADLDDISTRAVIIFKNPSIKAGAQVRLQGDFFKMRIFGMLNKLWHVQNVERFLKAAIDFYDKSSKATTTKTNQKQIDILVKSIDRLNGIISATTQQLRTRPGDSELQTKLSDTNETKAKLEREQHALLAVSVDEKKNDVKKLKELSQTILRILSKDDSRAHKLHNLLLQKVNPVGYADQLRESEERARFAEEQQREANELRRERGRIDRIVSNFSRIDKENYMKARELYRQGRQIPRDFQRFMMIIESNPYLSFESELTAKPVANTKVVMTASGSDYQYKQQFPAFGATTQPNAWAQKLGTKVEEKLVVQGAWTAKIDTEKLRNLPDPPKVQLEKKRSSHEQIVDEGEEDDWENYPYCTDPDFERDEEW